MTAAHPPHVGVLTATDDASIALIARSIALFFATSVAASALLGLAIDAATRCALTLHALMRVTRH